MEIMMNRCIAQINRQALISNLALLRSLSGSHMIAMVKANAYGHGLAEIAHLLKDDKDLSFGVASLDEAKVIRKLGAKNPILLFDGGAFIGEEIELFTYQVSPVIANLRTLHCLVSAQQNIDVHLKIDTGFGRHGFRWDELLAGKYDQDLDLLKNSKLKLEGLTSHLCSADLPKDNVSAQQIKRFEQVLSYLEAKHIKFNMIHWANSAAILRSLNSKSLHPSAYRPGLALYGIAPIESKHIDLKPILTIKAQILAIKSFNEGEGIGYGHRYISPSKKKVALIAIGYGDGLRRSLSNGGHVLVNGQKAHIIGTISMDSTTIDITNIEGHVAEGDMVTMMSTSEMAAACNTIAWEILTSLAARIKRTIV